MVVGKITRVANGKRRANRSPARRTSVARRKKSAPNPAHMLTLGYLNPKRRPHTMAKAKRKRHVSRATSHARRTAKGRFAKSNPHRPRTRKASNAPYRKARRKGRRNPVSHARRKGNRRPRPNPSFFGSQATPMKMAEYIAGGLIGVTINRAILPMLPTSVTSNTFFSTLASFAIALAEWWAGNMISKDFGSAVGFGALMNAGSTALNTFIPQVGNTVSLSGYRRRGTGDFVSAPWTIPDTSVNMLSGNPVTGVSGAYPQAYGF